ncbi:MAG: hypothetical protein HY326_13630 [Chloroflexi bacterium]|nr:hypothetical protein [Chloroflexota bacterium]
MGVNTNTFKYKVIEGWGQGPAGRKMGIVSSIATDSQDRVHVIDREPHPAIVVFDREGRFLYSWGEDIFRVPHAIWISDDDLVFITDCITQTVKKFTLEGKLLQTLGTPGQIGAPGMPFNRPTWAVQAPWGDIYVTDGYGQNRMHRFSADGTLLRSWGETGAGPGQFDIPHSLRIDPRGRLLVVDRSNARIQIFDAEGNFLDQWTNVKPANDLIIDPNNIIYLAEAEQRISILNLDGEVLARWGEKGDAPGQFVEAPHGIWMDSHGDLYVCEVPFAPNRLQKFERV